MSYAEALIAAWTDWEASPGSRAAILAKEAAIADLGLSGNHAHDHIAGWRRRGYSISDAVQSMVNDDLQESA